MKGKRGDRHYYDFESKALFLSFFPFIYFFLDITAVSHHNWYLKDIAKMSISVSQLVSQALITYLPSMPDLIRTAPICGCLPVVLSSLPAPCGGYFLGCWGGKPPVVLLVKSGKRDPGLLLWSRRDHHQRPRAKPLPPSPSPSPHPLRSKTVASFVSAQT